MTDQQNLEASRPASADPAVALAEMLGQLPKPAPVPSLKATPHTVEALATELGLKLGGPDALTIRRIKRGRGYSFVRANGTKILHEPTIRRLNRMRVAVRDEMDRGQVQGPLGADRSDRLRCCLPIADIDLYEPIIRNTGKVTPTEGEIIDHEDHVPLLLEMLTQRRADEACATSDEYPFGHRRESSLLRSGAHRNEQPRVCGIMRFLGEM